MDEEVSKKIEETVDKFNNSNKNTIQPVNIQVKPHLLYNVSIKMFIDFAVKFTESMKMHKTNITCSPLSRTTRYMKVKKETYPKTTNHTQDHIFLAHLPWPENIQNKLSKFII